MPRTRHHQRMKITTTHGIIFYGWRSEVVCAWCLRARFTDGPQQPGAPLIVAPWREARGIECRKTVVAPAFAYRYLRRVTL